MPRPTVTSSTMPPRWSIPRRVRRGRPSKALTAEQAAALVKAAGQARLGAYVVLCLLTGIRTEEARALRWDHVDLDARDRGSVAIGASSAATPRPRSHAGRSDCRTRLVKRCGSIASGRRGEAGRRGAVEGSRSGLHDQGRHAAGCGERPAAIQGHLQGRRDRGGLGAAGTADKLRQPAVGLGRAGGGDRPAGRALELADHGGHLPEGNPPGAGQGRRGNGPALRLIDRRSGSAAGPWRGHSAGSGPAKMHSSQHWRSTPEAMPRRYLARGQMTIKPHSQSITRVRCTVL